MLRGLTIRGLWPVVFWVALPAVAGPPLTTIQDVLYKADGTRFNGTLTISWNSFQAVDNSNIVTQVTTVRVVDGNLRVQLVPTTTSVPTATYTVRYSSDGRIQFDETWVVPPAALPLRLRDVRASASADAGAARTDSVPEANVVGLIADLAARPVKGTGYSAGRVTMADAAGLLVSVVGAASDCVRVDGSAGPCGASSLGFVDGASLVGIVDGANVTFGLLGAPDPPSSLAVYRNGILQKSTQDYTVTGSTVQFVAAATPQPGDTLLASYRTASGGGASETLSPTGVLCSGSGGTTSAATLTNLGNCEIPAGLLLPGNRVEVRFDVAHQGTAGGYSIEVHWGGTTMLHRDAAAGDALVTGRADAVILQNGAQLSSQSWGTSLPLAAGVASANDALTAGVTISFLGMTAQAADSLALSNFTVLRIP